MNKVWIVEVIKGDYDTEHSEIFKIKNTPGKARLTKLHLEVDISKIKGEYLTQYGSTYDSDWERISDEELIMVNEELYDELVDRLYTFQFQNELMKITNINIKEYDVS